MPRLLGIRIQNYKSLTDVTLGQVKYKEGEPLPALSCFIGPNGSGKSSLLDAFGFMADCLREGIEAACDKPQRGGFERLRTQGSREPIRFDLYYRESKKDRPITYSFSVAERRGLPVVVEELLLQGRRGQTRGQPYKFLSLQNGRGTVWAGQSTEAEEGATKDDIELSSLGNLGITVLGQFKEHPRIVNLRSYIESWYLSYFVPDAARKLPVSGAQKHLDRTGENLGNVVQYLERSHPARFQKVLERIARRIPGIEKITSTDTEDRRLLLRFNEAGYGDPFFQQSMSDGTLKMFAYLLLLEDPEPVPFIGIEEPENGLYHKLLDQLARQFLEHAQGSQEKTQVLVTTHSPYFVDALRPEQVWLLEKDGKGRTQARRAADMPVVKAMADEGLPLGSLWYSNHLEERFQG